MSYETYSNDILCLEKHYLFKKNQHFRVDSGIYPVVTLGIVRRGSTL